MGNACISGQFGSDSIFDNYENCLFELDDAGTILYCRSNQLSNHNLTEFVGRNLFDESAQFENIEEFRHRVNSFVKSDDATQKFSFECQIKNKIIPMKIMLVRVGGRFDGERDKTTLVDIRKIYHR